MNRLALLLAVLSACEDAAPPPELAPEPTARAPAEPTLPGSRPDEPWGIQAVRPCSEWGGSTLVLTGDLVVACQGHVFDAHSAELIEVHTGLDWFVGRLGDAMIWETHGVDYRRFVVDARLRPIPTPAGVDLEAVDREHLEPELPDGSRLLATRADGAQLVSTARVTELRIGDVTERVLDHPSSQGVFVGPRIVVITSASSDAVWLAPGAVPPPLGAPPAPPAGMRALQAMVTEPDDPEESRSLAFGEDGHDMYPRGLADVGAFVGNDLHINVTRSDARELARFATADDLRWAFAATERYVDRGEQRWAKTWRSAEGLRVARGHVYIGGCERTHIHVLIQELAGGALEIRTTYSAGARGGNAAFGPIPREARDVPGATEDAYQGDPSIGQVR